MRVLLSTIGSRGDVQPLVALALKLRELGPDVRMCVPPDFREWIEEMGVQVMPIGPDVRKASAELKTTPPTPQRLRQLAEASVAAQFETIMAAAEGCDILVGATALQIAAPSIAERMGIPYIFVAYCPAVLPSRHHPPIVMRIRGDRVAPPSESNDALWEADARRWNENWGQLLNTHRRSLGLAPVADVRSHIFTDRPWLAADPMLGPWPDSTDRSVLQTGAWIASDERPLSPEIESFLDEGDAPVYFGLGSMHVSREIGGVMVQAARAVGRRAILSRGWAELSSIDRAPDCLVIGEVNQQALFPRVAAVVHHGGAGTTTMAALGGAPQVVVPQMYDQHYWAQRVEELGIGRVHVTPTPSVDSLAAALHESLEQEVVKRAKATAGAIRRDGAQSAARMVVAKG